MPPPRGRAEARRAADVGLFRRAWELVRAAEDPAEIGQAADYAWELGEYAEAERAVGRLDGAELGRALLYQGRDEAASRALKGAGDDAESDALRAEAAWRLGRYEEAARFAAAASARRPEDPRLAAAAARNLVLAGRLEEAEASARAALSRHPGQPDLEIQLGYVRLLRGDDAKAEAIAAGRNRFGDDGGRHHFASPYRDDGRSRAGELTHEPELRRLEEGLAAAAAEPGQPALQDAVAKAWIKTNQIMCVLIGQAKYADAAALGHRTLGIVDAPQFGWEWAILINQIQQAYCREGRVAEAASLVESSLERAEREGTSRQVRAKLALSLSQTHLRRPTFPLSERWSRRAVELQGPAFGGLPDCEPTFSHDVGQAFAIMGLHADAEAAFRRALAFERRWPFHARTYSSLVGLAQALAARGEAEQARALCRRVLDSWAMVANPVTLVGALRVLASIGRGEDEIEAALRRFETGADEASVLARTQKDPSPDHLVDVMRLRAQVAVKNGRKDQARDWYGRAVERAKQTRPALAPEIEAERNQAAR